MRSATFSMLLGISVGLASVVQAQELSNEAWPPDTDFSQEVHYWSADGFLDEAIPDGEGNMFIPTIEVLNGGDQTHEDIEIAGKPAKRATNNFLNFKDNEFFILPDWPEIDILVQYFANPESVNDDVGFLLGVLGNTHGIGGYTYESVTDDFEWRLFRVDNSGEWAGNDLAVDPIPAGGQFGGVNGGTIRMERVNGLIVRAIAWGPAGVFGATETINQVEVTDFDPDAFPIVAEWDLDNGIVNGVDLLVETGGDQEVVIEENVGPEGDQRSAARPAFDDGTDDTQDIYVNWQILDEHFGPTSQPSTRTKVVVEYYDDPALTGEIFGPEVYTTAGDTLAFFPDEDRQTLQGTGEWKETVFWVPDVKFTGVNVETQAAARFVFTAPIFISRYRLGVVRTSGQYAGVDPIPDAYPFDPDPYAIYGELDLNNDVSNGIALGGSGGDQEYFVEENIGPEGDQRTAIRPALGEGSEPFDRFINFAIVDEHFGPSSQPNAVIKIAVDYWDNPELNGERFGPEVYVSNVLGNNEFQFYPEENRVTIEGTDEWRTAVFQINDMKFNGVNQGPQAAARFWFTDEGAIHISRVQYGVIRPVGENAGVDPLEDLPVNTAIPQWMLY